MDGTVKTVAISKLRLPGNMRERMASPHVKALAESYLTTRGQPLSPPIVRRSDMQLVAGADRTAAAMVNGLEEIDVLLLDATDDEIRVWRDVENAHRRCDPREKEQALARLVERKLAALEQEAPQEPARKPKKADAIRSVAKETGLSERQVYRSLKEDAPAQPYAPPPVPPAIDTLDLPVSSEILELARKQKEFVERGHKVLVGLQRDLTEFESDTNVHFQEVRASLHAAANLVRGYKPATLCHYCKGTYLKENCGHCVGKGFSTVGQELPRSQELLERGNKACVYIHGKSVPFAEVAGDGSI